MSGSSDAAAAANSTSHKFYACEEVSEFCPVEATVLGYYPSLEANAVFAAIFGICTLGSLYYCVRYKTWSYSLCIIGGCVLELAGYIGRVLMSDNPWNQDAFQTQICAIVLAPTLVCISIYLTLKHIALSLNPALSRVRPTLYPFIFVPGDVTCLVVQAIGGALAAAGGTKHPNLTKGGNNAIIAGISLQVVVLGAFGGLLFDYFWRTRKYFANTAREQIDPDALRLWEDKKFWVFVRAIWGAYGVIFARCIYRIAEMAGGWGNPIMQDEPSFIALDSSAMSIAVILLTFFTPGVLFPQMAARMSLRFKCKTKDGEGGTAAPSTAGEEEVQQAEGQEKGFGAAA